MAAQCAELTVQDFGLPLHPLQLPLAGVVDECGRRFRAGFADA